MKALRWLLAFIPLVPVAACDAAGPATPADPATTIDAASTTAALSVADLKATRRVPIDESQDPLVRAIADTTSILSIAGLSIRDEEWGAIQWGMDTSRLPPDRLRAVADQLFVAEPWPFLWPGLNLPRSQRFDEAWAEPYPAHETWLASSVHAAEPVTIYALPQLVQSAIVAQLRQGWGPITHIDARLLRDDGDAPVAVRVTVAFSDCGWCSDGYVYTIGPDGVLLEWGVSQEWSASGYCC